MNEVQKRLPRDIEECTVYLQEKVDPKIGLRATKILLVAILCIGSAAGAALLLDPAGRCLESGGPPWKTVLLFSGGLGSGGATMASLAFAYEEELWKSNAEGKDLEQCWTYARRVTWVAFDILRWNLILCSWAFLL